MTNRSGQAMGLSILASLAGLAMGATAFGQVPAGSPGVNRSPGQPQFVDPKTGQIWTPENVGGKSGPNTPADRAFDPLAQATMVEGTVVQSPFVTPLGEVPIAAGPTVPLVNVEITSLGAVPEQRWQLVAYLNNNSASVQTPVITCRFTNGGNPVEDTRALLPAIGPGVRVGFVVYGPKTNLFVDHATCAVASPQ
jgi:hypothetical protein